MSSIPPLASDSSDMVLGSLLLYKIVVKPLLEANINDLDIDFVDIIDRRDVLFPIEDIRIKLDKTSWSLALPSSAQLKLATH